jgi:predicted DNA-binding transcriptional regulator YafY
MPGTDRLFDLIELRRRGRLHRADDLAARLEAAPRTLWRDMVTLIASGLPPEGERAGRGGGPCPARAIRPLGLEVWDKIRTLAARCELRNDSRSFRVDRIGMLAETGTPDRARARARSGGVASADGTEGRIVPPLSPAASRTYI